MKIVAVEFNYAGETKYSILSQVLKKSIEKNCPSAEFTLIQIAPPERIIREKRCFDSNTIKIEKWLEFLETANDDVIFLDCDMIVLQDLKIAFDEDFDIGLTKRKFKVPYNGGAVFIRNNERAKDFIRTWRDINNKMFNEPSFHLPWRVKYAGMNQAALGYVLEKSKLPAKIKDFPAYLWNCCQEDWKKVNNDTKIIHIKSELRRVVMSGELYKYKEAASRWYSLARECGIKHVVGGIIKMERYKYKNYDHYIQCQKSASLLKKDHTWAEKICIQYLVEILKKRIGKIEFGICHGTRGGQEQAWIKDFLNCDVIGTEIADYATTIPNTVQHDFNTKKEEWIGKADFIYSNAFDHVFDPEKTINVWLEQLKPAGILVIEYSKNHEHSPTEMDPFSFEAQQLESFVPQWTNKNYCVSCIITPPDVLIGRNKRSVSQKRKTKFIFIERVKK